MSDSPLRPPIAEFSRKRVLSIIEAARAAEESFADFDRVRTVFNGYATVANKANVLLRAIEKEAVKYYVPVHGEAESTRAAVRRRSSDSPDGSQISFDLFRDCIDAMYRRKQDAAEIVLTEGINSSQEVFSKRMKKLRARIAFPSGDLPDDDLELLISQFLILWVAHHLMRPFESDDHQNITDPRPSDDGKKSDVPIFTHYMEGVLIQLMVMGVNEELLARWLDDSTVVELPQGMKGSQAIKMAKQRGFLNPKVGELANAYVGIGDHEKIIRYCFEYIGKTRDPGYEMWLGYVDASRIRFEAQNLWTCAPAYSPLHAMSVKKRGGRTVRVEIEDDDLNRLESEVQEIGTVLSMSSDHASANEEILQTYSDSLDLIGQTLAADWIDEAACCLARYLSKIDKDRLRKMRKAIWILIGLYKNGYALMINGFYGDALTMDIGTILGQEVIYETERFFSEVARDLVSLFGDEILVLMCCTGVAELSDSLMQLFTEVEGTLMNMLRQITGQVSARFGTRNRLWFAVNDQRAAQKLISILDRVLQLVEEIDRCADPLDQDLVERRLSVAIDSMPRLPTIELESNDVEKYFDSTKDIETTSGRVIPALGVQIGQSDMEAIERSLDNIEDTLRSVVDRTQVGDVGTSVNAGEDGNRRRSLCYRVFSDLDAERAANAYRNP